jgi:hypothetical protein
MSAQIGRALTSQSDMDLLMETRSASNLFRRFDDSELRKVNSCCFSAGLKSRKRLETCLASQKSAPAAREGGK